MPHPHPGDVLKQDDLVASPFDWPQDLEHAIYSRETLQPSGADLWILSPSRGLSGMTVPVTTADSYAVVHPPSDETSVISNATPLACASGNNVLAIFSPNLPLYRHLTAAKVACWYSHFQTIHEIADGQDEAVLVLEDDVDIEHDVDGRLKPLLGALPSEWDIIYLGMSSIPQA
jgi:hypothetical protein